MRARTCAIVSPKSAKYAGLVLGNGTPVPGAPVLAREQVVAAVRVVADRRMATVALQFLARAYLQPVVMSRADAATVGVEHGQGEGDIRGHLDAHRAVRLDRGVAQDLAHAKGAGDAERAAVEIANVVVRNADRLLDAHETRRPRRRQRHGGIAQHRYAARRDVRARDVIDAANVDDADALGLELGIEVDAGDGIEQHWRQGSRLQCDDVAA